MQFPPGFLSSLQGIEGFNEETFVKVHQDKEQVTSVRINPLKMQPTELPFYKQVSGPVPWSRFGYYLDQRPSFTFDPLLHAGNYYVQEASSMFLEQAMNTYIKDLTPLKVLDLCAAPGGKSTHLQSLLPKNSLLVSNEVIQTRVNILTDNMMRWGGSNVMITRNEAAAFGSIPGFFDVVVVDAPCSGSGLFRREPDAMNEWSEANVRLCCQRQQKILEDVFPALKEGGMLVYSTCSYSREEDEAIMDWLMENFSLSPVNIPVQDFEGIVPVSSKSTAAGYRFYPDKVLGEGFFLAAFIKTAYQEEFAGKKIRKPAEVDKKSQPLLRSWISEDDFSFINMFDKVVALPQYLLDDFSIISQLQNLRYAGVMMGELIRDKLIPHHALSLSLVNNSNTPTLELSYDNAIRYLQRKDMDVDVPGKGWHLVTYKQKPLGWVNVLPNRINNYYPKEMRILKEKP